VFGELGADLFGYEADEVVDGDFEVGAELGAGVECGVALGEDPVDGAETYIVKRLDAEVGFD
jgi:hypothetical protein